MKLTLLAVLALLSVFMMSGVVADSCRKEGQSCKKNRQCCSKKCNQSKKSQFY